MRSVGVTVKSKGFTLLELLISITLLTMLMAAGSFVYLQFASRWDKDLGQFEQVAKTTRLVYQLKALGDGIIPYVIHSGNGLKMFFVGKEKSLLAVSRNGLATGKAEVFRLTVANKSDGGVKLVYQSLPLSEIILTHAEQEIHFSYNITLIDGLSDTVINYYGWESLEQKKSQNTINSQGWYRDYDALVTDITPSRIVFDLRNGDDTNPLSVYSTLENNPEHWYQHYEDLGSS